MLGDYDVIAQGRDAIGRSFPVIYLPNPTTANVAMPELLGLKEAKYMYHR